MGALCDVAHGAAAHQASNRSQTARRFLAVDARSGHVDDERLPNRRRSSAARLQLRTLAWRKTRHAASAVLLLPSSERMIAASNRYRRPLRSCAYRGRPPCVLRCERPRARTRSPARHVESAGSRYGAVAVRVRARLDVAAHPAPSRTATFRHVASSIRSRRSTRRPPIRPAPSESCTSCAPSCRCERGPRHLPAIRSRSRSGGVEDQACAKTRKTSQWRARVQGEKALGTRPGKLKRRAGSPRGALKIEHVVFRFRLRVLEG